MRMQHGAEKARRGHRPAEGGREHWKLIRPGAVRLVGEELTPARQRKQSGKIPCVDQVRIGDDLQRRCLERMPSLASGFEGTKRIFRHTDLEVTLDLIVRGELAGARG